MTGLLSYVALCMAIVMTVGSQVLLKIGAGRPNGWLNAYTFTGVAMFGVVTVLIVIAMQAIFLKTVIAANSLTFVLMPLAANVFLGEKLTKRSIVASLIIVTGVIVFVSGG